MLFRCGEISESGVNGVLANKHSEHLPVEMRACRQLEAFVAVCAGCTLMVRSPWWLVVCHIAAPVAFSG